MSKVAAIKPVMAVGPGFGAAERAVSGSGPAAERSHGLFGAREGARVPLTGLRGEHLN